VVVARLSLAQSVMPTATLRALLLLLACVSPAVSEEPAGRQLYAEPAPLATLIDMLPDLADGAAADLAFLVAEHLAAAYEAELEQVRLELENRGPRQRELMGWYQATAAHVAELRMWQARLPEAEHVELYMEAHNQALMLADGVPMWVAWPRPSAQRRLERELEAEFCLLYACPGSEEEGAAQRAAAAEASGSWSLAQLEPPTWHSEEGVNCEFAEYVRIVEKEQVCRDVIADLQGLAVALRTVQRSGERIEWRRLGLQAGATGGPHRVVINGRGDFVEVFVPALAASPVDWRESGRWLEARVQGSRVTATVLRVSPAR
jgi:hypothetical protein